MNFTANVLLAAGAVPSMSIDAEEISYFVNSADALLINLGTLSAERKNSMLKALETANDNRKPWVLDPVFVNRSLPRRDFARQLMNHNPNIVRANANEIEALVDDDVAADKFANAMNTIVAQTGQPDIVSDGNTTARIFNGHPLMSRVTGLGCATSAVTAAFAAVTDNAMDAAISALLVMGITGEIGAQSASGPGSLQVNILDALYNIDKDKIIQRSRIE